MGVFKNGVGRPSNETIKKRNIFKVLCVLLVFIIVVMTFYILNDKGIINISSKDDKKTVDNKVNKDTTKENKIEDLSLNDDMVKDLYNRVSGTDVFNSEFIDTAGKKVYLQETLYDKDGKIVYAKDLSDDFKASMALSYTLPKNDFSQKENVSYDKQKDKEYSESIALQGLICLKIIVEALMFYFRFSLMVNVVRPILSHQKSIELQQCAIKILIIFT